MFKTSIITITLILFTQSSIFPTYGYFMRTNHYPQTYVFIVFYGRVLSIWRMMIIIMDLVMGMIII